MLQLANEFEIDDEHRFELTATLSLLSFLWSAELTRDSLAELTVSELAVPWRQLGGWLPESVDQITSELLEELAVDYCQLLIGPDGHASPTQSVWEEGQLQGSAADSMKRFFELLPAFNPKLRIAM